MNKTTLANLVKQKKLQLKRGMVISKKDIQKSPGPFPIYSSSVKDLGLFGTYALSMFDEELITWSVDGGGHFFHRSKHKFSVTNVCGYIRVSDPDIHVKYLAYHLQYEHSHKFFDYTSKAHPSVISKAYVISLPPLVEQQKIAAVLSDIDALIETQEALIAKKKDVKAATMELLLTGKKRLPGFNSEWVIRPFSQIAIRLNLKGNQLPSTDYLPTGDIPVIDQGREFIAGYTNSINLAFDCPNGGVIVFGDHTCIFKYINFNFAAGADGTQIFAVIPEQSCIFHYYQLDFEGVKSTGYNRHYKQLKEKELFCPSYDEQIAISKMLTDLDDMIFSYELEVLKMNKTKSALMHKLLTGEIRLP